MGFKTSLLTLCCQKVLHVNSAGGLNNAAHARLLAGRLLPAGEKTPAEEARDRAALRGSAGLCGTPRGWSLVESVAPAKLNVWLRFGSQNAVVRG